MFVEGSTKKGHFEIMIPDNEIKDAFDNLARLKGSKIKKIDSIMLHAVLVLYMYAGLKKKEITKVKIKDIKYTHGRITGIDPNSQGGTGSVVPLTGFPARVLDEYLGYLKSSGKYNLSPNSPLFPDYAGDNGQRQINRHLKKIPPFKMGDFFEDWDLDALSEFGMADYYKVQIKSGKTENQAIQNTAKQYRVTERTVTDNINQDKKETQASFDELRAHWDQLAVKEFSDQTEVDEFREKGIKLIKKMKIKGKNEIIEMFNSAIDDRMANLRQPQPSNAIENKKPSDLKKALEILAKEMHNSREEQYTRKRVERYSKKMEKFYFDEESK
jgi:hypothetical protein